MSINNALKAIELMLADYAFMARSGEQEITIPYDKKIHEQVAKAQFEVTEFVDRVEQVASFLVGYGDTCEFAASRLRDALSAFRGEA